MTDEAAYQLAISAVKSAKAGNPMPDWSHLPEKPRAILSALYLKERARLTA